MLKIFSKKNKKPKDRSKERKPFSSSSKKWRKKYKKRRRRISIKNSFLFSKAFYRKCFRTKIFRYLFALVIFSLFFLLVRYFILTENFDIKKFEIIGTKNLNSQNVARFLEDYKKENIFLVRSSSIENELSTYSTLVKDVKVDKVLPNTIIVEFEERIPHLLWVDLGGIYLFDTEGILLEVKKDFQDLELNEEDQELLRGYGNLKLLENEEEDKDEEDKEEDNNEENTDEDEAQTQQDEEKEKELTKEEKLEELEEQRQEVISRVNFFLDEQTKDKSDLLNKYQVIYSYHINSFEKSEQLNNKVFKFSEEITDIELPEEEFKKYVWESDYRMVIYLTSGRKIIFSVKRDLSEQIESLNLLMVDLKKDGKVFQTIDLSSEVIMYELEQ